MNPITLIGDTFVFVGRQWRLILRANWWVILIYLAALIGSSWLSLRLLGIVSDWMSVDLVRALATATALSPEFLTLVVTGVIAQRVDDRLGGIGVAARSGSQGHFMTRWIVISGIMYLSLVGIEIANTRYLEILSLRGDFEFQGIVFMIRHYANVAVFFAGLLFLVAAQVRITAVAGGENAVAGRRWRSYLAATIAGLVIYMSVALTISEIFLYFPPMGFLWATLDRLQPPYFFLTEIARIVALTAAPIIYAGFIIVAGNAVRRWRA